MKTYKFKIWFKRFKTLQKIEKRTNFIMSYNNKCLSNKLIELGKEECERVGSRSFGGKPDRWYDKPKWRCINNHVSKTYIRSDEHGSCCIVCFNNCYLTYPEDEGGKLIDVL